MRKYRSNTTRHRMEHRHDPAQLALGGVTGQATAVARRSDPPTSHEAAASVQNLRASHLYVLQLFRTYGPMSDPQAWEAHQRLASDPQRQVPRISPSGLRSRRAELCPPRGAGLRDSGRRVETPFKQRAIVWELSGEEPNRFTLGPL